MTQIEQALRKLVDRNLTYLSGPEGGYSSITRAEVEEARAALASLEAAKQEPLTRWQPIETAPQDGYMLVHEDGAIRALLRINGAWHKTGYPGIVTHPWGDVLVGDDAKRILPPGYRLELRDGCCDSPTHWMPLPAAPDAAAPSPGSKT